MIRTVVKRIIHVALIISANLGAVEFTVTGGGNRQAWQDFEQTGTFILDGTGWHAGAMIGLETKPGKLPVTVGGEGGLLFQRNYYEDEFYFQDEHGAVTDTGFMYWRYNNLMVPLLIKGTLKPIDDLSVGLGTGLCLLHPLSGRFERDYEIGSLPAEEILTRDQLDTYLAWQIKGEAELQIFSRVWLKPSITGHVKIYELGADFIDKYALMVSLGLAWRL